MKNIWILLFPLLAYACAQNNDFVTETGVEVSCVVKGDGPAAVKDSIVVLYLKIESADGEVLTETTPLQPLALPFDPEMKAGHLQEVLTLLEVGDSVTFTTTAKNLFEETYQTQIPPNMDSASLVTINMKFVNQMSQEGYRAYVAELREQQQAEQAVMLEKKLTTDGDSIDAYLQEQGIEAITTESGLRYVVTQEGSGQTAEPGDKVTVHYDGRLFSGEPFDSSNERGEPFTFDIGVGRVIPGWDEGIAYIKEGGKGTLYIPSPLGYGARGAGAVIKPYSILVFDVDVLKVEKNQ